MNVLLFEDEHVERLAPLTTGRAAFAIGCASFRLIDLIRELSSAVCFSVRPHLAAVTCADFANCNKAVATEHPYLMVNDRLAPLVSNVETLEKLAGEPAGTMIVNNNVVLAAVVPGSTIDSITAASFSIAAFSDALSSTSIPETRSALTLDCIDQLHDLVRFQCASLNENLQHRIAGGSYTEVADGVFVADKSVNFGEPIVTNTKQGPIVMETGCSIGPFTYLEGPVYLGSNCKVAEHSSIKDCVSAGTTCKLGGEIEATSIESYSNKQHHGFLGHSFLGSWINLGAGTCNSDLKNTYGKVNMRRDGQKIETGMQFVGCFIGDYAKTAINTSIFTGKTLGVGSMVYGFAASDVAAFTNHARLLGKVTEIDPDVMVQTQARMFARRNVPQRDCDIELVRAMFRLTSGQRHGLSCEPLVL